MGRDRGGWVALADGCVFCGIASGGVPARVLAETESTVAFMDASPLARGHALAIPRRHRERIQDMGPAECADLFETVRRLVARTDRVSGATLVAVHNGRGSGQEVPHVHVHMVPRGPGDGAGPVHRLFDGSPPVPEGERFALHGMLSGAG